MQLQLKIMNQGSGGKAPRFLVERFAKLTENLSIYLNKNFLQKKRFPNSFPFKTKEEFFTYFHQQLMDFYLRGTDSSKITHRQYSARSIAGILRGINKDDLKLLGELIITRLMNQTIKMLRNKNQSLKMLGLRISHYLQVLKNDVLTAEIMRCMSEESNKEVRKSAMSVIKLTEATFPEFIRRLRDVETSLRIHAFKKLITEQVLLANMKLCNIYKIVYDGIGSREDDVKLKCLEFLRGNLYMYKSQQQRVSMLSTDKDP